MTIWTLARQRAPHGMTLARMRITTPPSEIHEQALGGCPGRDAERGEAIHRVALGPSLVQVEHVHLTFDTLANAVGIDALESVLLYHVVPGATIDSATALKADGAQLNTALPGTTFTVDVLSKRQQLIKLRDNDRNDANPFINRDDFDINEGNVRLGEATVVRAGASVDLTVATTLPLDARDGFIEVWLINRDGKRMVSVGVLQGPAPETFPITQTLIDQGYVIVDISREGFDNKPQHSGDSLARGTLRI